MLPPELRAVLPDATAAVWPKVAAALPEGAYLADGTALAVHLGHRVSRDLDVFVDRLFDTDGVRTALERSGDLTVTTFAEDTLNGMLDGAKVQFLEAASHRLLDVPVVVAEMPVAGVRDLMTDKLKVVRDRGELRDYFDLMSIEKAGVHRCEQGLAYYRDRYGLGPDDASLTQIVRALGYLDDVADDPGLPVGRGVVEDYWEQRQPALVKSLASLSYTHGVDPVAATGRPELLDDDADLVPPRNATVPTTSGPRSGASSETFCDATLEDGPPCQYRAKPGSTRCGVHRH